MVSQDAKFELLEQTIAGSRINRFPLEGMAEDPLFL